MTEQIEWKSYYQQEPIEEDIYFRFVCFYMAMTELYDRRLTDERSSCDKTEAYISDKARGDSEWYAKNLYNCTRGYILHKTKIPFDIERWKKQTQKIYSAQGWINMLEYFKKEKDEIILDMEENIWEYDGRNRRKMSDKREKVVIKNPFL